MRLRTNRSAQVRPRGPAALHSECWVSMQNPERSDEGEQQEQAGSSAPDEPWNTNDSPSKSHRTCCEAHADGLEEARIATVFAANSAATNTA